MHSKPNLDPPFSKVGDSMSFEVKDIHLDLKRKTFGPYAIASKAVPKKISMLLINKATKQFFDSAL